MSLRGANTRVERRGNLNLILRPTWESHKEKQMVSVNGIDDKGIATACRFTAPIGFGLRNDTVTVTPINSIFT